MPIPLNAQLNGCLFRLAQPLEEDDPDSGEHFGNRLSEITDSEGDVTHVEFFGGLDSREASDKCRDSKLHRIATPNGYDLIESGECQADYRWSNIYVYPRVKMHALAAPCEKIAVILCDVPEPGGGAPPAPPPVGESAPVANSAPMMGDVSVPGDDGTP